MLVVLYVDVSADIPPAVQSITAYRQNLRRSLNSHLHITYYSTTTTPSRISFKQQSFAGLPLTGVRVYYTPENLTKTPKLDGPAYKYAQNKMAGVHVRRKIISGVRFDDHSALLSL